MADPDTAPRSFSAGRRWGILFSVAVSIAAAAALVVMANYLAARHHLRTTWSTRTRQGLSPQTLGVLNSISNDVKVTIYFDREDPLYNEVRDMLNEYHLQNPRISVRTVDYVRENGAAVKLKAEYGNLLADDAKDLVIFDCNEVTNHRPITIEGKYLWDKDAYQQNSSGEWEQRIRGFQGEEYFSGALAMATHPELKHAGYLQGHNEHPLDSQKADGYLKFKNVLLGSQIDTRVIYLDGTNTVPADCQLLIIAGPQTAIPPAEVDKVRQYLSQGGKLMVLFNNQGTNAALNTGLEALLREWKLVVPINAYVTDPGNEARGIMMVRNFATNHPISRPLLAGRLGMIYPRAVGLDTSNEKAGSEDIRVQELAKTSPDGQLAGAGAQGHFSVPLAGAVEKQNVRGGETRIVVVGDSIFLDNEVIDADEWQNADFARLAANWLLDQTTYMGGISMRPRVEYRLTMTRSEFNAVRWIFLAGMPGGILLLGGLVWLRRRR